MISWRGYGSIVLVFAFVSVLIAGLIEGRSKVLNEPTISLGVMFAISAIALWFLGSSLNNGDNDKLTAPHVFMWLPLQYTGVFFIIGILAMIIL